MKVDPNQNICAYQQNYVEHTPEHEFGIDRVQTIGGIPLRLELAARFMAARIAREYLPDSVEKSAPTDALKRADALIAAHNATCGENHDEQ